MQNMRVISLFCVIMKKGALLCVKLLLSDASAASAHRKAEIEDKNHQIYQTGAEYNVRQTQKLFYLQK